jgi:hypothetical protein
VVVIILFLTVTFTLLTSLVAGFRPLLVGQTVGASRADGHVRPFGQTARSSFDDHLVPVDRGYSLSFLEFIALRMVDARSSLFAHSRS